MAAERGRIEVRVTPGAGRDAVTIADEVVHLRVTVPPADGAANEAVIKLLAAALGIAKSRLTLLRGAASRNKLIGVDS